MNIHDQDITKEAYEEGLRLLYFYDFFQSKSIISVLY